LEVAKELQLFRLTGSNLVQLLDHQLLEAVKDYELEMAKESE